MKSHINLLYSFGRRKDSQLRKESIIVPIHKKGIEMDCNNYRGISLLSTSYKIFSKILLAYANEIIGEYQCGFKRNRSITDLRNENTIMKYVNYS